MTKLRCLIVDDEPLARKLTKENIGQLPFLEWVASCKNAYEAMESLNKDSIDLIFLDIQMPGMMGTTFLSSLPVKPMVIFITAYDNYAVESYNLDVVDYLVKPVSMERFTRAAYKALQRYQKAHTVNTLPSTPSRTDAPDHFFIHVEYALVKVIIKDILYIEGMKDYVKIYLTTSERPVLTKSTLKAIEEKIGSHGFMRIHKSFIVQLDKIEAIRNHRIKVGNKEIPVSQANLEELLQSLKYL